MGGRVLIAHDVADAEYDSLPDYVANAKTSSSIPGGDLLLGRTTMYGGYLAGKPTTYCETTGTGGCRRRDVADYVAGLHRALAHLGILSAGGTGAGASAVAAATPRLDTIDAPPPSWSGGETDQAFSGHMQSQNCTPTPGLWRAKVDLWETVFTREPTGMYQACTKPRSLSARWTRPWSLIGMCVCDVPLRP